MTTGSRPPRHPPVRRNLGEGGTLGPRSAFTLIELLVVVVIIAILVGLILGVAGIAQRKAADARARADIEKIKNALELYRMEYGKYPVYFFTGNPDPKMKTDTMNCSTGLVGLLWRKPQRDNKRPFLVLDGLTDPEEVIPMKDPWGLDYLYIHRATSPYAPHNDSKLGYDLWSRGPMAGTNVDDIANWGIYTK